jgi:transposase
MSKKSKLDGKLDTIIELILEGYSYRKIAERLEVPLTTLHDYTSKGEHSARAREALEYSAQTFDDKAEEVLINAKSNLTEVQRARELAQHYRWKASKRNPKRFGDKLDTNLNHSGSIEIKAEFGAEKKE